MNKQELFQLIIKHQLPDRVSREAYCTCGAPIGDWATFYVDHLTNMIIEALSETTQPCPSHCDECNPYHTAQLLRARHDAGLTAADIPKGEACPGCTGDADCPAPAHQHGCFADLVGHCNEPEAHAEVVGEPEREALAIAERELLAWCTGTRSWTNMHTSDPEGWAACALHDAAHIKMLTAQVEGLRVAAGYRREPEPRVVTTIEELDALPVGTVIRDDEPAICEKSRDDGRWLVPGSSQRWKAAVLPARILFTPSAERGES